MGSAPVEGKHHLVEQGKGRIEKTSRGTGYIIKFTDDRSYIKNTYYRTVEVVIIIVVFFYSTTCVNVPSALMFAMEPPFS